jgi:excisionase family DNA binding protein
LERRGFRDPTHLDRAAPLTTVGPISADREGVDDLPEMLTPGELARLLHVDAKTVSRWCRRGRLTAVITPGGHRRIPLAAVLDLLPGMGFDDQTAMAAVRRVARIK